MKNIYICEDNEVQLRNIKTIVEDFLAFHKEILPPQIVAASSPNKLLDLVDKQDTPSLYLLDVDFGLEQTGIELAEKIRKFDPRGLIIFITTHDELLPLTFKRRVEAFDYIAKNAGDFRSHLLETLTHAFERIEDLHKTNAAVLPPILKVKIGPTTHFINEYDLICAEIHKERRRVKLRTKDGILEYSGTLSELKKCLSSKQFYQCHRSALINLSYISSIDNNESIVHLTTGTSIPISTRKKEELLRIIDSIHD